jgi:hypothetical protein
VRAAEADTNPFLINDSYLVGRTVPGIKFIAEPHTDLL